MAHNIHSLFLKYLQQTLSAEELEILFNAVKDGTFTRDEIPEDIFAQAPLFNSDIEVNKDLAFEKLMQQLPLADTDATEEIRPVSTIAGSRWYWAAAAVLLVSLSVFFLWFRKDPSSEIVQKPGNEQQEILPGKNGAVLTLADGRQVVLDSLGNGVVATQGGGQVLLQNGQLSYEGAGSSTGETAYNTMQTPKGRQFNLRLSDGTMVWLNAASSLRYPVAFPGKERRVEISGEAYFEVAQNQQQPFIVSINDRAEVEVLGTSFNVNAYVNESSIRTALLTGSVKVTPRTKQKAVVLKPGQLARITADESIRIEKVDEDRTLAWKNGAFNFNGASLDEVMKQLERWYDIEVVYESGVPDIRLGGELSRDVTLTDLLKGLKESELHFKIESGRRLVILP
ncbi:MAG: FecR family protein [Pseudobacter sp.]|uniref:FecR family protein n=1 Tax=Pseudobacter sp. TaxID=2045420 RepID=UPI003F81320D